MLLEYRFEVLLVQTITCTLSVLSSAMIIFFYLYLNQLKQSFTFMVIFYIALSDFLHLGILLFESIYGMATSSTFSGWFCMAIGYFEIALALSNFFWVAVMSYCIYNSIIHHRVDFLRQKKQFYVFSYVVPAFISAIPFISSSYGPVDDIKCWITGNYYGSLERLLIFYLPLVLVLIYSFWTVYKVWGSLRAPESDRIRKREITRIRNQFLYYPLALALCFLIPLIHRILDFIDIKYGQNEPMLILHNMSAPLQGFLNAIVYGTSNRDVRHRLWNIFCCMCLRKPGKDGTMMINMMRGEDETMEHSETVVE